jgi:hypothetical protein
MAADDVAQTLRRSPAAGGGELVLRRRSGAGPHGADAYAYAYAYAYA